MVPALPCSVISAVAVVTHSLMCLCAGCRCVRNVLSPLYKGAEGTRWALALPTEPSQSESWEGGCLRCNCVLSKWSCLEVMLNAVFFGQSVYVVILEMRPTVGLGSFWGAMPSQGFLFKAQGGVLGSGMGHSVFPATLWFPPL